MKKAFIILSVALTLLAISGTDNSVQAATIGGTVATAAGRVVPGAIVIIQQTDVVRGQRPYAARVQADRGGVFVFENVPGGHFVVGTRTRIGSVREEVATRANGVIRMHLIVGERENRVEPQGRLNVGLDRD